MPQDVEVVDGFPPGQAPPTARALLSDEAVELLSTRPRYAARAFVWLLVPFLLVSGAWAALSRVDVVVIADAVLVAEGDVLKVRAPMPGVLARLHVREGAVVSSGAPIYELTSREAAREVAAIERSRQALALAEEELSRFPAEAALTARRVERMGERLRYLEQLEQKNRDIAEKASAEAEGAVAAKELQLATTRARLADAGAEIELREAALARHKTSLEKAEKLLAEGVTNETLTNQARDRFEAAQIELRRARAVRSDLQAELETLTLDVSRTRHALSLRLAEIDKDTLQTRAAAAQLRTDIEQAKADLEDARRALETRIATAKLELGSARMVAFRGVQGDTVTVVTPVEGIVTQLAVRQPGELVGAGDLILTIRPTHARLVAEATVLNKDIGLVEVGQPAKIKYEAYPFMDYGIKTGRVTHVPPDATPDPARGPVYLVTVTPDEDTIMVDGQPQPLAFGLRGTVEIVTEQKSVLSFFLRPFDDLAGNAGSMPR